MSRAQKAPLYFLTQSWGDPAWTAKRNVVVRANRLILPGLSNDLPREFYHMTLDPDRSGGRRWKDGYDIEVATRGAASDYSAFVSNKAVWPSYFGARLGRQFARGPYDIDTRAFVGDLIEKYRPRLARQSDRSASTILLELKQSIIRGVDEFGWTQFYVPRGRYEDQVKDFKTYINTVFGTDPDGNSGLLFSWDRIVVDQQEGSGPDRSGLDQVRAALKIDLDEIERMRREAAAASSDADELEDGANRLILQLESLDNQRQESVKAKEKQRQDVAKIKGVANAITYATPLLPFAAPVTLAIGAATQVGAGAIAQHNSEGKLDIQWLVTTVPLLIEQAKSADARMRSLRNSWAAVATKHVALMNWVRAGKVAKDKGDPAEEFGSAVVSFVQAAKVVFDGLEPPHPQSVDVEDVSTDIKAKLDELAAIRAKQGEALAKMREYQDRFIGAAARETGHLADEDALLSTHPQNDYARARMKVLALAMREEITVRLAKQAAVLRRAFVYHTGKALGGPEDLLFFGDDDFSARRVMSQRGLNQEFSGMTSEELRQLLKADRSRSALFYRSLALRLKEESDRYFSGRFGVSPRFATSSAELASAGDNEGAAFLVAMNNEIKRQIGNPESRDEVRPIALPSVGRSGAPGLIQKLIVATVDNIELEDRHTLEGDKSLEFTIVHPGFGRVTREGTCFVVDLRSADASQNEDKYPTLAMLPNLGQSWEKVQQDRQIVTALRDGYRVALPPLDAAYYLIVRVNGNARLKNWDTVPRCSKGYLVQGDLRLARLTDDYACHDGSSSMTIRKLVFAVALCATVGSADAQTEPTRIYAIDGFPPPARTPGSDIVIETAPGEILVFDAARSYLLDGRDLAIDADTVEVTGDVTIRAFTDGDTPAALAGQPPMPAQRGADGGRGSVGTNGKPGPKIRLKIAHLVGNGNLTIINTGRSGGQGHWRERSAWIRRRPRSRSFLWRPNGQRQAFS